MEELTILGLSYIKKDQSTDYQYHSLLDDEVLILEGTGSYVLGEEEKQFMEGDTIHIPAGTPYRFRADRDTVMWSGVVTKGELVKLIDEIRK